MLEITCVGSPREIGLEHGQKAARLVQGSVAFYSQYFMETSKMDWTTACSTAAKFIPFIEQQVPDLVEEMRGIADGAGLPFNSVLALNVRTEIAMGMMTDGCTSLAWCSDKFSVAGQNWDWMDAQKDRLVILHIKSSSNGGSTKPAISTVTEAGIVGKIGLNSAGVAVFLNAIFAKGVNFNSLPVHIALRSVLETRSRADGIALLERHGVAAASHILIADNEATSLEFSASNSTRLDISDSYLGHTNHYIRDHDVQDLMKMTDSAARMRRVSTLLEEASAKLQGEPGASPIAMLEGILEDEHDFPVSINRKSSHDNPASTLFTILVDLKARMATVKLGRPTQSEGTWTLKPRED